jgi:hypothetical protein
MKIEGYKARDLDRGIPLGGKRGAFGNSPGIIYTKEVRGQRPQREWYDAGRDRAQLVISSNLHRVFNINDPMDDI